MRRLTNMRNDPTKERHMRSTLRFTSCALFIGACGGSAPATPDAVPSNTPMTVFANVENQSEFDAMIYAYRSGKWTRIGLVEADSTRLLQFTWDRKEVRFVIELIGNNETTDLEANVDARKTFAADVFGNVPCHLTAPNEIEPNIILVLVVGRDLQRNAGGSRCQPRDRDDRPASSTPGAMTSRT